MVGSSKRSHSRYRWSVRLTLVAFIVALIAGWILWQRVATSSISDMQRRVDDIKPIATGIRMTLIGVIAIGWPTVTRILHARIDRAPGELAYLEKLRWRVVIWLIVMEFVLGQHLLGRFLSVMQGDLA